MAKKSQIQAYTASLKLRDGRNERYYLQITAKSDLGETHELLKRSKEATGTDVFLKTVEMARASEFVSISVERYSSLVKSQPSVETITLSLEEPVNPKNGMNTVEVVDGFFAPFGGFAGFNDFKEKQGKAEIEMFLAKNKTLEQEEKIKELKAEQAEFKLEIAELKRKNEHLLDKEREHRILHEDEVRNLEKRANIFAGIGAGIEQLGTKWLSGMSGMSGTATGISGTPIQSAKIEDIAIESESDNPEQAQITVIAEKIKKWLSDNPKEVAEQVLQIVRFIAKSEDNFTQLIEIIKLNDNEEEAE